MSTVLDDLIVDRTQKDIVELQQLRRIIATQGGISNMDKWNAGLKGALNYNDLNRIGDCLRYFQTWISNSGITVTITARNDWTRGELVTSTDLNKIKTDILTITNALGYPFNDKLPFNTPYFGHNSTEIDPTILDYIQYNLIEDSIKHFMPTLAFRLQGGETWHSVSWTPEDTSVSGVELIMREGYNPYGAKLEEVSILGYGNRTYIWGANNPSLLSAIKKVYINASDFVGGFTYGENLEEVVFSGVLTRNIKNLFYDADTNRISAKKFDKLTITDGVLTIGRSSFQKAPLWQSVTLPDTLTQIGDQAFFLSGVHSIVLPKSLQSIGNYCFSGCIYLSSISYKGTMSEWANVTKGTSWADNVNTKVVHCSDGDVNITFGNSVFETNKLYPWKLKGDLKTFTIPYGTKTLGDGASVFFPIKYAEGITSLYYDGTISEWSSITKRNDWNYGLNVTVVHCSNGDVSI